MGGYDSLRLVNIRVQTKNDMAVTMSLWSSGQIFIDLLIYAYSVVQNDVLQSFWGVRITDESNRLRSLHV
jgi:hypothetical protein